MCHHSVADTLLTVLTPGTRAVAEVRRLFSAILYQPLFQKGE